ncbi:MAG: class I SAM-dependent methyltransferase [Candidatus Parvarchaeota archaeon]
MKYWKDHFNNNVRNFSSLKKQLDFTIQGREMDDKQVELRVNAIKNNLRLDYDDIIVDACCGNGMLTKKISQYVSYIYAFDFSEEMINVARERSNSYNISYSTADVANVDFRKFPGISKINIYSCLQYLSEDELESLFKNLAKLSEILVYIGNIPDKSKIWDYYNTEDKKRFYLQSLKDGKPHIGTWWERASIRSVAEKNGFKIEFLKIDSEMSTSYYRFDALVIKER